MKYTKFIGLILFFLFGVCGAFAQGGKASQFKNELNISESESVRAAWLQHIDKAQSEEVTVFRVQVYSGQGQGAKQEASDVKTTCVSMLPNVPSFIEWKSPYFKVSVGNFKDKSEATKTKEYLSSNFPGAFIVSTKVAVKILLSNE
ncbi:MAG: hypothetical protein ACK5IQ_08720 [Bacteroidales bacterium]